MLHTRYSGRFSFLILERGPDGQNKKNISLGVGGEEEELFGTRAQHPDGREGRFIIPIAFNFRSIFDHAILKNHLSKMQCSPLRGFARTSSISIRKSPNPKRFIFKRLGIEI